jgi:hypothetical protein
MNTWHLISKITKNTLIFAFLATLSNSTEMAIASGQNQPVLTANKNSESGDSQPNRVFQPILPKLKQKTKIRILLPNYVPESDGQNRLYAILETATKNKYEILLGFSPDCQGGTACRLGFVAGEAVTSTTPPLSGKPVPLAKGMTGYFEDSRCGANCSDATLTWRQRGIQYTVGIKAGDRTSLIKMANSVITP